MAYDKQKIYEQAKEMMKNTENGMMDEMGMEEDLMPYPAPDKQYPNASKYSSYESVQTGAMGKAAK